ncbi:tudor domain-containing protein 1-like [Cyprinus carpio]|uniref:Tudor domain-containing protein 1-like n=1 Tax=Cyprinus carpio TaxID=7962 RepID=A0A9Q9YSH8_CYPCA|nr:tudor domain-containing protein 1-like [Cyprinus carpio]
MWRIRSFLRAKFHEPCFAEKESSAEVSYHWMIATSTELWDIGDIFSDAHQSLPEPFPNEVPDFNFQADCKVPDLSSRSVCPSAEESWRLKDGQSPDTLTDHTEDDHAVHVTIPEFQSRRFEEIPVVISHVVHPNKFFIQHKDTDLCQLSEIMQRNSSRSLAEMNRIPDIGAYVMVWFLKQEMWCRGQIIRIRRSRGPSSRDCKDTKVEVRRIDYGDVVWVSLWDLKELCGETASIPVQALQVSLANVRPVNGETWSFEAISWFRSKVQNKTLYARLYPEEGEVLVELFMEKGKIGAMRRGDSLSVRLALNRFAIHECNKPRSLKRSDVPEQTRQQSLQWEKYLDLLLQVGENPVDYWIRINKAADLANDGLHRQGKQLADMSDEVTRMFIKHCPDPGCIKFPIGTKYILSSQNSQQSLYCSMPACSPKLTSPNHDRNSSSLKVKALSMHDGDVRAVDG